MSKQVTNTVAFLAFFDQGKAQLPLLRITEQPILLAKSKIDRASYKFSNCIFAKNRQSTLVLVLILVLESKSR